MTTSPSPSPSILTRDDRTTLIGLGRTFGLSIRVPSTKNFLAEIQAGPPALREAADMLACAMNSHEERAITELFVEGCREQHPMSFTSAYAMLKMLANLPEHTPVQRPVE